jgi:hypothetical protein
MKCILTPNPNPPNNLRRIMPAYGSRTIGHLSEDELIQHVIDRNKEVGVIPVDASYWVVDVTDLPGGSLGGDNDYFFEAWEWDDGVVVNMTKARGIHMNVIRKVRDAELAAKDITFMRAVEAGDTSAQATIATQKQTLRDIPATFDITTGVTTPAQLKAKWPSELPARE